MLLPAFCFCGVRPEHEQRESSVGSKKSGTRFFIKKEKKDKKKIRKKKKKARNSHEVNI